MDHSDIKISDYNILDGRNMAAADKLVLESDCIVLVGGYFPTQNAFLKNSIERSAKRL